MLTNTDPYAATLEALNQSDSGVRLDAVKRLGALGDQRAVPVLIQLLEAKEAPLRGQAAVTLAKLKHPQAIEPLIRVLQTDSPGVARKAATALARFSDPTIAPVLIQALDSPHFNVKEASAQALGRLRDPRAVPRLMALVEDKSVFASGFSWRKDRAALDAYWAAVNALGKIKDPQAIPILIRAFDDGPIIWGTHSMEGHCGGIADTLVHFGRAGVPILLNALVSDHEARRSGAIMALRRLAYWQAVPTIVTMLQDSDYLVATEAANFLVESGDPQAIAALAGRIDESTSFTVRLLLKIGEAGREALWVQIQNGHARKNPQVYEEIGRWMLLEEEDARFVAFLTEGLSSDKESVRLAAADVLSLLEGKKKMQQRRPS